MWFSDGLGLVCGTGLGLSDQRWRLCLLYGGEPGLEFRSAKLLDKVRGVSGVRPGPKHVAVSAKGGFRPEGEGENGAGREIEPLPDLKGHKAARALVAHSVAGDYVGTSAEWALIRGGHTVRIAPRAPRAQ